MSLNERTDRARDSAEPASARQTVRITREYSFDMGHRLLKHEGLCHNIHGHRYVVEVTVSGTVQSEGPESGMVADFARLDAAIKRCIDGWDHALMLERHDPVIAALKSVGPLRIVELDVAPTAENICTELARRLHDYEPYLNIHTVRVYETPRSWAESGA